MTRRRGSKSRRRRPRKLPPVGAEGMATHGGITFRARVVLHVQRRDGAGLVVAALNDGEARGLPAATVTIEPGAFLEGVTLQRFTCTPAGRTTAATDTTIHRALAGELFGKPCPNCGQRHAVGSHGCTDGG